VIGDNDRDILLVIEGRVIYCFPGEKLIENSRNIGYNKDERKREEERRETINLYGW